MPFRTKIKLGANDVVIHGAQTLQVKGTGATNHVQKKFTESDLNELRKHAIQFFL